ncbi:MAG: sulfite exporter TauE/SafE family protein [Chloroflexi bacterium]|nr:sulfite exporter TauE/SafE family protein [Chloroflexota bacterium]
MTGAGALIIVSIIGAIGEMIDGSLGMGFGVISASLMIGLGFAPAVAVATVNASKILTGLASGLSHWKLGNIRWDWFIPLVLGGVSGGVLGAFVLSSVPSGFVRPVVGILLLGMGGLMIWRFFRWPVGSTLTALPDATSTDAPIREGKRQWLRALAKNSATGKIGALGFVAAFVSGLTGAYGPIATSGMMLLKKSQPRHAVGSVNMAEIFVASAIAMTILLRQGVESFPVGFVIALVTGGAIAAPLGAYICRRLPARALTFSIGAALIALNVRAVSLLFR